MSNEAIERRFREAEVPLLLESSRSWFSVRVDRSGARERILLAPGDSEVTVLDADRDLRQLLILVRDQDSYGRTSKAKYLCGQDERSLFAVSVGTRDNPLNSVREAHEALKPWDLRQQEPRRTRGVRRGQRRRPPRYLAPRVIRQGDWFFEPRPWMERNGWYDVRRNFRLGNAGGNPHVVEYLLGNPNEIFRTSRWSLWQSGLVFARGFVRHREHKPIHLRCWHRVLPNSASQAVGWAID